VIDGLRNDHAAKLAQVINACGGKWLGNITSAAELADVLEPPPKQPVSVHSSFHPTSCVCAGQGTDRTCSMETANA
jgi:hypothetical protein